MESSSSKYPKFNNWESDPLNGNRGAKVMLSFSMLLIVWIPIIYILLLPGIKGRVLEIKENGLAVYDRKDELKDFHRWNTLVDMSSKHLRYGDITVLKFSDGTRIKFYEESWIITAIREKCSPK